MLTFFLLSRSYKRIVNIKEERAVTLYVRLIVIVVVIINVSTQVRGRERRRSRPAWLLVGNVYRFAVVLQSLVLQTEAIPCQECP